MKKNSLLGIALKLGSSLAYTLMYSAIKLAGHVPVGEVVFFRAAFAFVPLFLLSRWTIGPRAVVHTKRPLLHVARSFAGVASMFLYFAALTLLPLADITAFSFVAPIFAVVLAALLLHEKVGALRWGAAAIGFAGVLLMLEPHGGTARLVFAGFSAGAALALAAALLSAFVVIFIRQMSATEQSETIVFYFMLVCAAAGAATMVWSRMSLTGAEVFWLVLCGILGGIGQICMTYCYRYAEPSLLAPFDYVTMIWAVLLGYFIFAEVPKPVVMGGALLVIAAGLGIIWRERARLEVPIARSQPGV